MLVEIDIHISIRIHGYDNWGQLLTESGTVSGFPEAPYSYSNAYQYDSVGNIKSFSDGTTTHTYAYEDADWKDLLTSYDGQSITYDSNGNPTSYFNGNRWTFGWENGRQLTTLSKQAPVIITTQPENFFGTAGSTATFTVKAEGDRVTYQWQRSKDEGKTWTDISGETSETLNVTIQSSDFGSQYRCIAKDFMGHVATSQAGKLASSIASQSAWDPEYTIINEPDDYYGRPGDIATFIVEAEGKNLSYQWLYQAPGTDELVYCTSSDATTNTIRVEMTAESDGAQYCCFITDANGDMGSTRTATVRLDVRDWTMEYEAGGLRTKRSSAEKTYNYIYNGNQLVRMTVGDDILDFTYDANGAPLTLIHNGTVYYYITNLQGDVISLETMDGMLGAHYHYDAWGKILACDGAVAELNPLRYRGYVYDQETGFYYLQSRYYDPAVGRWINVDSILSTEYGLLGYDLFAYCNNNPANNIDQSGQSPFSVLDLADYRIIHKMVQAFCMVEYNWDMEVYVKGPGSRGFLDLYDYRKNEYYEVKSDKIKRERIMPQMDRYDKSVIAASRYKDANIIGSPKRGDTYVAGSFPYGLYDITYWTKEDGLIVYRCDLNGNRTMACAVALVTIFCVATGNIPGAIGAGTAGTGFVGAGALLTGLG